MDVTRFACGGALALSCLLLAAAITTRAQAQGCPEGQHASLGWCCPVDSMWDRRYRQCVPDPRRRCAAGELAQCVTVGEHYAGVSDFAQATIYHRKACGGGELAGCVALGYMAHKGQGRRRNDGAARALFQQACDGGHVAGCTGLAELSLSAGATADDDARQRIAKTCLRGDGRACALWVLAAVDRDEAADVAAVASIERACDASDPLACTAYARHLATSDAAQRSRALELHARACLMGEPLACLHQGTLLSESEDEAELGKARVPLQQACAANLGQACARLGELFASGSGGVQDGSRAREHHRQACELGIDSSCMRFADLTLSGPTQGRDAVAVREAFERGCERGADAMCVQLAALLLDGEGGSRDVPRARKVLRPSCEGGQPEACRMLADSHGWEASGARGADARRGYGFAVELLTRACTLRDAAACTDMGLLHMVGGDGVRRDFGVARRSFERACGLGHAEGCLYAGRQALYGHGGDRDDARAAELLQKACSMGAMAACEGGEETPAVQLYPAPYAPGTTPPRRYRPAEPEEPSQRRDLERAPPPAAAGPGARARDRAYTPAHRRSEPRGDRLGSAFRVAFGDGNGQQITAVILEQSLPLGSGFDLTLALPFAFGQHTYDASGGASMVERGSAVRSGNVRVSVGQRRGDAELVVDTELGLVLPTAVASAADVAPQVALLEGEALELTRPTLVLASAAWGLREHVLWSYDTTGIDAVFRYRARADVLRVGLEAGAALIAPVRRRDNGEAIGSLYGELGVAAGPVVFALGMGVAYLSDEDTGMVSVEPSVQHVAPGGERIFLKGVIALEPPDAPAGIEPPPWSLQLGAGF